VSDVDGEVRHEELDRERELRRRIALSQVRQYPDPALRLKAGEVEDFDDSLQELVARMARLMREANGVGLAANQIGVLRRVFVYQIADEEPLVALVNPRIVTTSEELASDEEGCLSIGAASIVVEVERPAAVTIEAFSQTGEPLRVDVEGLAARVVQHELDHLNGVLIIDRTSPEQRRQALGQLRPQPQLGVLV
jgi:peptide deformylase